MELAGLTRKQMKQGRGVVRAVLAAVLVSVLGLSSFLVNVQAQAPPIAYPSLSKPASLTKSGKNDVAIIVAVENYVFLPAVEGASANATDWEGFFKSSLGVPSVHMLIDRQATREQVERFAKIAASESKAGGTVWFVFIGHGSPSRTGDDGLLVGVDAQQDPESLFARGFSQQELLNLLNAGEQAQTAVIVDAFFSGRASDGQALAPAQPVIPTALKPRLLKKTVVLSAAQASEFAGALPGASRPAFSYLLLGALRGWAGQGGEVSAEQALGYTEQALRGIPGRFQQTPGLYGDDKILLVKGAKEADPGLHALMRRSSRAPERAAVSDDSSGCEAGKTRSIDTAGKCCWPGQAWNGKACIGIPSACPNAMFADAANQSCALAACETGMARPKGQTHCCWPDQTYAESRGMCVGLPKCPRGMQADGQQCVPEDPARWYEASCQKGDMAGCARLGDLHRAGRAAPYDLKRALELAQRACKGGDAFGCSLEARVFGLLGQDDYARAFMLNSGACEAGVQAGCVGLATLYHNGNHVSRDYSRALELYEKGCQAGDVRGCNGAAIMYDYAQGVTHNASKAVALYEKSCQGNEMNGCSNLALMYAGGRGLAIDERRAAGYFEKACDGHITTACNQLGVAYRDAKGVAADGARAHALFQRSCDAGNARSCHLIGHQLDTAMGIAEDLPAARRAYEKACSLGEMWACVNLGVMHRDGRGISRDLTRAHALFEQACNGKLARGCSNLGHLYAEGLGVSRDAARGVRHFQSSCEGGDHWGCNQLGWRYHIGDGIAQDHVQARTFYEKACQGNEMQACVNLGILQRDGLGTPQDFGRARASFEQACNGAYQVACTNLGALFQNGTGVARDFGRAHTLYEQACNANEKFGCRNLGVLYRDGLGVAKDVNHARTYLQKACTVGLQEACDLAAKL